MALKRPLVNYGGYVKELAASDSLVGAGAIMYSVNVGFTDGDTLKRVTVIDANVTTGSKIVHSVRRPDTAADANDRGYIYICNIVKISNGSFDLLIACLGWGTDDPVEVPPNETISIFYTF